MEPSLHPSDRISNLPDCVLLYILSFLRVEEAYKTSFISRRFRNLWKQLPDLDFAPSRLRITAPFVAFVDKLLSLYDAPSVHRFRVVFYFEDSQAPSVLSWIRFAFDHHVQELDLVLFPRNSRSPKLSFTLPSSSSLRSLKLQQYFDIDLDAPTRFQSLERVSLSYISCDGAVIGGLVSCSPRLTNLDMGRCDVKGDLNIVDSKGQLVRLRVGLWSARSGVVSSRVEISAPNLKFLEIANCMPRSGYHLSCPSLLSATFDFEDMLDVGKELGWYQKLVWLLDDVAHAKSVSMCRWCIKVFFKWREQDIRVSRYGTAHNPRKEVLDAEHLNLSTSITKKELHGIALLLRKFHQVDTLSISMKERIEKFKINHWIPGFDDEEYWKFEELLPPGLPHLKTIDVNNFLESERYVVREIELMEYEEDFFEEWGNEFKLVEFLLENCSKLNRMTIRSSILKKLRESENYDLADAALTELLNFPRSSPDAELYVI